MKKTLIKFLFCAFLTTFFFGCKPETSNPYASLYGTVSDSETLQPLGGVTVSIFPGGTTMTTGSNGHYQFNNLDVKQYKIQVQKEGYLPDHKDVTARTGEDDPVDFQLKKTISQ